MLEVSFNRRGFLSDLAGIALVVLMPVACRSRPSAADREEELRRSHAWHPVPRPGINASHVLSRKSLVGYPDAIPIFDMAREIPVVMDGIRCHCNCAGRHRLRSLLSCFEGEGMAKDCSLCLEQAARVYGLHRDGKSLGDIRAIIDAVFA